ncbi:MAG: peptidylprolyl isomerase, partial [Phycisphaerales bacterium]
ASVRRRLRLNRGLRPIIALLGLALLPGELLAQLTPDRLYSGVGQRVVVTVETPEGYSGELTIRLHDPRTLEVIRSATAAAGRADLTSLFPDIWAEKSERVVLAQLYLGSEATGSPLVIQPLVTPNTAVLVDPATMRISDDDNAQLVFEDDRQSTRFAQGTAETVERETVFSGLRVYADQEVVLETSEGEIVLRLRPDAAPNTVYNFMHLVEGGFYRNIIFHRIVAALADGRPFVVQMGDPSGTGMGGPGYAIDLEKSDLPHDFGVVSMARGTDPNTNGSQVFICLSREGTAFLDGRYTAFAQAVSGAEVIRRIAAAPVDGNDRPLDPPMVLDAKLRPAPPVSERTPPVRGEDAPTEGRGGGSGR